MILLMASLALFLVSMYFLAEVLTSNELYDICWYSAKSIFTIVGSLICLAYAVGY